MSTEVKFPVAKLDAALPQLRRPFAPEAVKFKVQSSWSGGALIVSYIDARLVIERLNLVCGGNWHARYARFEDARNLMECHLTVFDTTRVDVGDSTKGLSKDLYSDALKRAAVHFGVGISIYALRQPRMNVGQHLKEVGQKKTMTITDEGHAWLRDVYARWLDSKGAKAFGDPLDHGDEGDRDLPTATPVAEVVDEGPAPEIKTLAQKQKEKAA